MASDGHLCDLCSEIFDEPSQLQEHLLAEHDIKQEAEQDTECIQSDEEIELYDPLPVMEDDDIEMPIESEHKLRSIVSSLRRRTLRLKSVVEQPPTPTDQSEEEEEEDKPELVRPQELILEDFTESRYASKLSLVDPEQRDIGLRAKLRVSGYIDPRGNLYIGQ